MAEVMIAEWLRICSPKFAVFAAQNMQPITSTERALIEIVKYGSKIFTEPDVADKSKKEQRPGYLRCCVGKYIHCYERLPNF